MMRMLPIKLTMDKPQFVFYKELQLNQSAIHHGHLILVNREHPIRLKEQSLELLPVSELQTLGQNNRLLLEKTCLRQLMALVNAASAKNDIIAVSGFRSQAEQRELYESSLRENGAAFTASFVARPDESEHQTGLAVDVGENKGEVDFICPSFPDHGVCQTFKERAAEYGFIQRYKKGKESITKIACEPWHFRYVGFPHALIMEQNDFCLEEYIAFLNRFVFAKEHFYFETESTILEIYYVKAAMGSTTVPIPNHARYELSGNNADGFVVTVFHEKGSEQASGL
ncbi:M15 family metallopeptidase [Brevibacillus reuszeri]|uniref:M15 family metallopeptidase n=1 Tax=Brevibacillus reuszeri TaxID=54915 RepID=UPI0028A1549C|nr:M15 family metallopeptidase [Brevibacillus reuszeri]